LTNVRRHAGAGATARVTLGYGENELTVRVDDDGRGDDTPLDMLLGGSGETGDLNTGGGNGIEGMRERVAALGGALTAGPRPEGGFRVLARLPVAAAAGTVVQ
jgi:signal transduction histidine kinase